MENDELNNSGSSDDEADEDYNPENNVDEPEDADEEEDEDDDGENPQRPLETSTPKRKPAKNKANLPKFVGGKRKANTDINSRKIKSSRQTRSDWDNQSSTSEKEGLEEEIDPERGEKLWKDFLGKTETLKMDSETKASSNAEDDQLSKPVENPWMNSKLSYSGSPTKFGGLREFVSDKNYASTVRTRLLMGEDNNQSSAPRLKRGGLSFLSGDPEQIGLAGNSGGKGGLASVLAALRNSKKERVGTLEKSRQDWEAFKKDEGIQDELQTQIKSKDGYLERQEFLQRSDLRTFEIEKNMRERNRRHP